MTDEQIQELLTEARENDWGEREGFYPEVVEELCAELQRARREVKRLKVLGFELSTKLAEHKKAAASAVAFLEDITGGET